MSCSCWFACVLTADQPPERRWFPVEPDGREEVSGDEQENTESEDAERSRREANWQKICQRWSSCTAEKSLAPEILIGLFTQTCSDVVLAKGPFVVCSRCGSRAAPTTHNNRKKQTELHHNGFTAKIASLSTGPLW